MNAETEIPLSSEGIFPIGIYAGDGPCASKLGGASTLTGLLRVGDNVLLLGSGHGWSRGFKCLDLGVYRVDSRDDNGDSGFSKVGDVIFVTAPPKKDGGPLDGPVADVAVARMLDPVELSITVLSLTDEYPEFELGTQVAKNGVSTGVTTGRVVGVGCSVYTKFGWYRDLALVEPDPSTPNFSVGGDSGALVVDENHSPLGIIMAGPGPAYDADGNRITGNFSVVCTMQNVVAALSGLI